MSTSLPALHVTKYRYLGASVLVELNYNRYSVKNAILMQNYVFIEMQFKVIIFRDAFLLQLNENVKVNYNSVSIKIEK